MTKVLLCIALLAMSYIASADVTTYALPLTLTPQTEEPVDYLSRICETADGKFYYLDGTNTSYPLLQVWDSNSQTMGTAIPVLNTFIQVASLIVSLDSTTNITTLLQCTGNNVYVSVAYDDNSTNTGIELFLLTSSSNVSNYTLPLTYVDLAHSTKSYLAQSCQTTDGKLHYLDGTDGLTLQVWDLTTQTIGTNISLAAVQAQMIAFTKASGDIIKSAAILQCIGTNVYFNLAYENDTDSGIELFLVGSSANISYSLPIHSGAIPEDPQDYMSTICSTADGKLHYMDATDNKTFILQEWDSNTQTLADAAPVTDLMNQVKAFVVDLGAKSNTTVLLQCIGNNVYTNVAYNNGTNTGIELFLVQKSAGILSFSYAALFLALVALLL